MTNPTALDQALFILATVHTRDNNLTGFTVQAAPSAELVFSGAEYIAAWRTVRKHLKWRVDPPAYLVCKACEAEPEMVDLQAEPKGCPKCGAQRYAETEDGTPVMLQTGQEDYTKW